MILSLLQTKSGHCHFGHVSNNLSLIAYFKVLLLLLLLLLTIILHSIPVEVESRTTKLIINLADNTFLDAVGVSPIGVVVKGFSTVVALANLYNLKKVDQDMYFLKGNQWMLSTFPDTAVITKIILQDKGPSNTSPKIEEKDDSSLKKSSVNPSDVSPLPSNFLKFFIPFGILLAVSLCLLFAGCTGNRVNHFL